MADPVLQREAADWFLLHRSGEMTPEERAAFEAWCATGPEALAAFRHAERMWGMAGDLGDDPRITAIRSFKGARDSQRRRRTRQGFATLAAGLAALALVSADRVSGFLDVQLAPVRGGGQVLDNANRPHAATRLADGTLITLDHGSRLRVLEMGARRRVELLAGHAYFQVAKDPAHPFLVTAMNKTVHALGTAFDVRIEPDAVAVTLVEGKVRVDQTRGLLRDPIATEMTPGKQLIAANDQVWLLSSVDTSQTTAWLDNRLGYAPGAIGQIVADVNRGSHRKIVLRGPIDERQRIIGVFERGDVDSLATVLEVKGIARVVSRSDDEIVMVPADH